jgi:hypothetical protein
MTGSRRPSGAWTSALLWRLCAALALLALAATPAGAANTATVQMFSDAGDYIGGGAPRFFYPGNGSITISGNAGYFAVSVSGGSMGTDDFTMTIAAPPGENLHTGLYTGAQRAPFRQSGHAGLDIGGDGRGCNEVGGRFDVKDFHVGINGVPDRLWITFEQHCENFLPALFGEIRLGEPDGSTTLLVLPRAIWWPDVAMKAAGSTVPVTLLNIGSSAVSIATVAVDGLQAADFPVQLDGCAGHTLQPGAACQVFLKFTPKVAGPHVGRLVATDGTAQTYVVPLDGYGAPGVTSLVMHSDPGDFVGAGLNYKYTPGNAQITISGNFSVIHGRVNGQNGDSWFLDFAAKPGDILKKGKYKNATRYPFNGNSPGLDVFGNGRGCNTLTGDFKVKNIAVGIDNTVQAFSVKFTQHCEGVAPALRGTLMFQVPKGDTTPPAQVSSLVVTRGQNSADVSWINPADPDFGFTLVRFLPGTTAPGAPDSGFLAFAGAGASVSIPGVPAGQSLAIAVYTVDTKGNVGSPVISVTP